MGAPTGQTEPNDPPMQPIADASADQSAPVSHQGSGIEIVKATQGADPALAPNDDVERAHKFAQPFARFMKRWRVVIRRWPWLDIVYKAIVTVVGVAVVLIGIILIPLPGPGWLIVFIGLTILGSEYHWARRLTSWARVQLSRFWERWRTYRAHRAEKKAEKMARKEAKRAAAEDSKRSREI